MIGCGRNNTSSGNSPTDTSNCMSALQASRLLWLDECKPWLQTMVGLNPRTYIVLNPWNIYCVTEFMCRNPLELASSWVPGAICATSLVLDDCPIRNSIETFWISQSKSTINYWNRKEKKGEEPTGGKRAWRNWRSMSNLSCFITRNPIRNHSRQRYSIPRKIL